MIPNSDRELKSGDRIHLNYGALAEQVPYLRSLNAALMKTEPGKKLLTKYLAVSDQDIENFKKMLDMGVEIGCYTVPTEKSVNITKYL